MDLAAKYLFVAAGLQYCFQQKATHESYVGNNYHNRMPLQPNSCGPKADGPFCTPKVGPIHIPNIGSIDEGLISISAMESHPYSPVTRINAHDISYDRTTTKYLRPNGGWSISGPQVSVLSTPQILDPSMKDWYQYRPWNLTHRI